jgi:hypothetical protein
MRFPFGLFAGRRRAVVSVVHLRGLLSAGRLGSLSLERTERALEAAFAGLWRPPDAVALNVNSPGGSPVQSALLHRRIRELAQQHGGMQVLTFAGATAPRRSPAACACASASGVAREALAAATRKRTLKLCDCASTQRTWLPVAGTTCSARATACTPPRRARRMAAASPHAQWAHAAHPCFSLVFSQASIVGSIGVGARARLAQRSCARTPLSAPSCAALSFCAQPRISFGRLWLP